MNEPFSNFDLIDWVKKLGIKPFCGVFSRNNLPQKIQKECGIVNLDNKTGPRTRWVCYRNIDPVVTEYFDPYGLPPPSEVKRYLKTMRKKYFYSRDEIQEKTSVLCGY